MSHQHRHHWTQTGDIWHCTECQETSPTCINTNTNRGHHPTGTPMNICNPCLKIETWVLDDIHSALTHWDERDRHPERSPTAYKLVQVTGTPTTPGHRYPEDIHLELLAWAIRWAAHTGAPPPRQNPTEYLKTRHVWAAHHPETSQWDRYRKEARELRTAARAVAGLLGDAHPEACMHCEGRIVQDRADHNWNPLPGGRADSLRCTGCNREWDDRNAFQRNVRHHIWALPHDHPDKLVTIDQATRIFPEVPRGTFRYWLSEDRKADVRELPERDWTRTGDPLYRLGDLHAKVQARADETRRGRPARVMAE